MVVSTRNRTRDHRPRRFKRGRSQVGMTLVELMVAISIIAIIMSGLALSIGVDYKAVALARARQVAESVANKRIEELRDVDYSSLALSSQPTHSTDSANPDYYVSTDGTNYDVTGSGQNETLIVASTGGVQHLESPVTVGTTVVDVYQYVTWVDDPSVAGTQNLKRLSVVVQYHTIPILGGSKMFRESQIFSPGTVSLGASATTTTSTSTTSTTSSTTTTTTPTTCGSFSVAGSSGASGGYTASTTVTITMSLTGCGSAIANFSNDGGTTWGADVTYSSSSPTVAWTLTSGDGSKTISGRARNGSGGTPWSLTPQFLTLDTIAPTTPGSFSRTVSCSGSTRNVTLSWTASTDAHLVGYHVYLSTDGVNWSLLGSTANVNYADSNSKTLTSVRYYVTAYDSAGNNSSATSIITLSKNQCS